jgi:hypothetical protein
VLDSSATNETAGTQRLVLSAMDAHSDALAVSALCMLPGFRSTPSIDSTGERLPKISWFL